MYIYQSIYNQYIYLHIYPSIHYQYRLSSLGSRGAGADPSWHWAKAGIHIYIYIYNIYILYIIYIYIYMYICWVYSSLLQWRKRLHVHDHPLRLGEEAHAGADRPGPGRHPRVLHLRLALQNRQRLWIRVQENPTRCANQCRGFGSSFFLFSFHVESLKRHDWWKCS